MGKELNCHLDPEEEKDIESFAHPSFDPTKMYQEPRILTTLTTSFRFLSSSVEEHFTVFGTDRLTNTRTAIYFISYQMGLNAHFLQHAFLSASSMELLQSSVHLE